MKTALLLLLSFAITARVAIATAGEFSDAAVNETFTFANSPSRNFVQRSPSTSTARSMFSIAPALTEHRLHIPSFYDDEKATHKYQQAWESYLHSPRAHWFTAFSSAVGDE